jgi:prepilin-type N-terminal cleavage/methylation domain-containing protein
MLKKNKLSRNQKGFSLIELMVAVAILALVAIGIFQAYTVGFMGMADARDRTVAVNYLQQKIEDFKNMDFNKVRDEPITLIPDTKFHRGSIVLDLEKQGEEVTLKKIITQVRWMDRDGNIKIEEASTLLYNRPNTSLVGATAVELVLYAESYYTLLPETTVKLIAEIRDEYGNIFDYDGTIDFSIVTYPANDPPVGSITTPQPVSAIDGVAICYFLAVEGEIIEGTEKIQASATVEGKELLDTVNLRVTTGPVGIIIEPATENDKTLPASLDSVSTINLKVVKADYETSVEYDKPISLKVVGPGTLSTSTIASVPTEGITFTLTSNGTPGVVGITASAIDLDMGYTEVVFTGQPHSILVSTQKKSIYPSEETTITLTIVDENNTPVNFGEVGNPKTVVVSDSPDVYSTLDGNSGSIYLSFEGEKIKTCIFQASSTGEFPQNVTVSAADTLEELNQGSVIINILSPIVAHHLFVPSPDPSIVEIDNDPDSLLESEMSEIVAIMYSEEGDIVYGKEITFEITSEWGSFSNSGDMKTIVLEGGIANATLYPYGLASTQKVIISIYSYDLLPYDPEGPSGNPANPIEVEVLFHQKSAPHHIILIADPAIIYIGGQTCTLTAKVVDEYNVIYSNYDGRIEFTIADSNNAVNYGGLEVDATEGIATINLTSTNNTGTVNITAETMDLSEYGFNEVSTILSPAIVQVKAVDIELVDNSIKYFDDAKIVMFDIYVSGPKLDLESMLIEWGLFDSKLKTIEIKSPSTAESYNPIIDAKNASTPYTKSNINAKLLPGESTIRFTFSKSMNDKLDVTFTTKYGLNEYPPEKITIVE